MANVAGELEPAESKAATSAAAPGRQRGRWGRAGHVVARRALGRLAEL